MPVVRNHRDRHIEKKKVRKSDITSVHIYIYMYINNGIKAKRSGLPTQVHYSVLPRTETPKKKKKKKKEREKT